MREPKNLDNSIRLFCSNLFVFTNISYIIPKQGFQVKVKEWPTSCYLSCCFLNDLQWTSILSFLGLRSFLFLSWVINAVVPEKDNCYYLSMSLKYGFCNKSFQKDEPLTSWTLFSTHLSSLLVGFAGCNSKPNQKWWQIHMLEKVFFKIYSFT